MVFPSVAFPSVAFPSVPLCVRFMLYEGREMVVCVLLCVLAESVCVSTSVEERRKRNG